MSVPLAQLGPSEASAPGVALGEKQTLKAVRTECVAALP